MNITTFNDALMPAMKADGGFLEPLKSKMVKAIEAAPLLLHEDGSSDWNQDQFPECFEGHLPRFPFPSFRAQMISTDGLASTRHCVHIFVYRHEFNGGGFAAAFRLAWTQFLRWEMLSSEEIGNLKSAGIPLNYKGNIPDRTGDVCLFTALKSSDQFEAMVWTPSAGILSPAKHDLSALKQRVSVASEYLSKLCIDWLNPHFFPCKVAPKKQGKSIHWIEQRSHYVLVHKSHPANQEGAGRVITGGMEASSARMAHARRAHFRLLRSPKFKNKVGQRIFIKATWCGPKEWEDASGQIYRIVDKPTA